MVVGSKYIVIVIYMLIKDNKLVYRWLLDNGIFRNYLIYVLYFFVVFVVFFSFVMKIFCNIYRIEGIVCKIFKCVYLKL